MSNGFEMLQGEDSIIDVGFEGLLKGEKGDKGEDGITPHINPANKHWMIGDVDTGVKAEGSTIIQGGGSGGGSFATAVTITNKTGWISKSISFGSVCKLRFSWSSLSSTDNGLLKVTINGATVISKEVPQGDNEVDVTKYLPEGINSINVEVSDAYGNKGSITFGVTSIEVSISSYFDWKVPRTGNIRFTYTPYGDDVEKTVHFVLDGNDTTQTVTTSGEEQEYYIPAQNHGSHSFEVYFTATIDDVKVESNHLYYDLICYETGNPTPIIAVPQKTFSVKQYGSVIIPFIAYQENSLTSDITLNDENGVVSENTVDRTLQRLQYRALTYGTKNLSIKCGETVKPISLTVEESDIKVSAVTSNLELYLTSQGRSNSEKETRSDWYYKDIKATLSNFNFTSDGWKLDEENNTALRVSGDARVYIPFEIFNTDLTATGKTIEIEFATRDVMNYDADIITCLDDVYGIKITAQKASLKSKKSEIFTQFKENETVRIAFAIENKAKNTRLLYIYINGIMSGVVQYGEDTFEQSHPVGISIGSNDCTTDIYCIRVYKTELSARQLLDNWIADTQSVELMAERYERNNILDSNNNVIIDNLPQNLPYMVIYVDEYSKLPQNADDEITVSGRYIDPIHPERCFTFKNATIAIQGTTSLKYARKNYKIKFKGGFDNNGENNEKYQLREDSIPTNIFTFKADVASSEGANNVELVRLYDDTCPVNTPPQTEDDRVRQGIEGYPMLMFYGTGAKPTFLGKYNFNNDKSTPEVFGLEDGDESWESRTSDTLMSRFRDDDFSGDNWENTFEARYPKGNTDPTKLAEFVSWLKSTDTMETGLTEAQKTQRLAKFKDEFKEWCNVDAMLFNYIFTEMFLMTDNRAKNVFPTRYDEDGKWLILPYDFDTAIGTNNKGALVYGYDLEDTDVDEYGEPVYSGSDSVLYNNMRLAFHDEIKSMYKRLRSEDVFSFDEIEKRFDEHQSVWGETIFNIDAKFKYLDPLTEKGDGSYLSMLQGSKSSQRKWWLYNRFRYLDSKYIAGDALEDYIELRPRAVADLTITPYADIYATAEFEGQIVQKRAKRREETTLKNPLSGGGDPQVNIYSASQLSDIGDLSPLKLSRAVFSKAIRLSSLKIGNEASGYKNGNLNYLDVGNLTLLRDIDVRNCTGLTQYVDLSGCTNIERIYFDGTNVTGVKLPNGGIIKTLHLPSTVTDLTVINQGKLIDFVLPSYSQISTLRIENTPNIPIKQIVGSIPFKSKVRLVGFDLKFDSSKDIYSFYDKLDNCYGVDEFNNQVDNAVVNGTIRVDVITQAQYDELKSRYNGVNIIYKSFGNTVTFIADGKVFAKDAQAVGGKITSPSGAPKKEQDAQYTYSFRGWSLDGVNVLDDLGVMGNEEVTYYAVFVEVLRGYTVRFFDGEKVLSSQTVKYGDTATPPSTDKENYMFLGWEIDGEDATDFTIYGDTDFYGKWEFLGEPRIETELEDGNVVSVTVINYITAPSLYAYKNTLRYADLSKSPRMTTIKDSYFSGYKQLSTAILPESLTSMGDSVFSSCSSLTYIRIPSNVKEIAKYTFRLCKSLAEVSIPDDITSIGDNAFSYCESLKSFDMPDSVTSIGAYAFMGSGLDIIKIPNGVTKIEEYTFNSCKSATSVIFNNNVVSIGEVSFYGCENITSIVIPDSVTEISQMAFSQCTALENVTIGSGITSIGDAAFNSDSALKSVTVLAQTPPTLGKNMFTLAKPKIYVPYGCGDAYKSATNWSAHASRIEELPE